MASSVGTSGPPVEPPVVAPPVEVEDEVVVPPPPVDDVPDGVVVEEEDGTREEDTPRDEDDTTAEEEALVPPADELAAPVEDAPALDVRLLAASEDPPRELPAAEVPALLPTGLLVAVVLLLAPVLLLAAPLVFPDDTTDPAEDTRDALLAPTLVCEEAPLPSDTPPELVMVVLAGRHAPSRHCSPTSQFS